MTEHQANAVADMVRQLPELDASSIIEVRGVRVILDSDLAELFDVETRVFNQAFKRNQDQFPTPWAFELTQQELATLKSQSVISSGAWGGRRSLPWAFTEHGVVMAASLLSSDRAKTVMQLVVEVFVQARRGELERDGLIRNASKPVVAASQVSISKRLQTMIERLMETMVSHESSRNLQDEAQAVLRESIEHIKARLGRAGFENEEIAARAAKLIAEAEATRATAAKTRAEADDIALRTLTRKLAIVLEAERAMARGQMEGFLDVLKQLGKP